MQENKGRCPACNKKFSMQTVSKFNGRDWTGALCKRCGHFVPDVMTKRYDLSCWTCKKQIPGTKSLPYYHHEMERDAVQEIRDRLAAAKGKLAALEKAPKGKATDAASRDLKAAIDQIEALKIPPSWQERHEAELQGFFCLDCHKKRRESGSEFEDETFVRHQLNCMVCDTAPNWVDIPEDKTPEEQAAILFGHRWTCTGDCTAKKDAAEARQRELDTNQKAIEDAAKAVASSNKVSANA